MKAHENAGELPKSTKAELLSAGESSPTNPNSSHSSLSDDCGRERLPSFERISGSAEGQIGSNSAGSSGTNSGSESLTYSPPAAYYNVPEMGQANSGHSDQTAPSMVPYSGAPNVSLTGSYLTAGYQLDQESLGGSSGQGSLGTDLNIWGGYPWNQAINHSLVGSQTY